MFPPWRRGLDVDARPVQRWIGSPAFGVWQRWDACWYLRIAEFGYESGEPGTAFFPVYPIAIRLLGPLFLGNLTLAALVVTQSATSPP